MPNVSRAKRRRHSQRLRRPKQSIFNSITRAALGHLPYGGCPKGLSSFLVICARHKQKSLCLDSHIRLLSASQRLWLPVAANTGGAKTAETGSDGGKDEQRDHVSRRWVVCSSQTGGAKNRRHGTSCLLFFFV